MAWLEGHLAKTERVISTLAAHFTVIDKLARRSLSARELVAYVAYHRTREQLRRTIQRLTERKRRLTPPPDPRAPRRPILALSARAMPPPRMPAPAGSLLSLRGRR